MLGYVYDNVVIGQYNAGKDLFYIEKHIHKKDEFKLKIKGNSFIAPFFIPKLSVMSERLKLMQLRNTIFVVKHIKSGRTLLR